MTKNAFLLGAALTLGMVAPASAQELVQNGGFETGSLAGWTNNPSPAGGYAWNAGTANYPDGRYGAVTGCGGATCTDQTNFSQANYLFQDIATTAGSGYTLNFGYTPTGAQSDLKVLFGNTLVADLINVPEPADNSLIRYSFSNLVATGATTRLTFLGRQDPSYATLDSVSLTQNPAVAAVPEPASWAMMIVGFGMIGAGLRFRQRRTVLRYI